MTDRIKAYSVHLLTATGAVLAMLAMLAAAQKDWSAMFFWLVVALIVDGVDGPLARRYDVQSNAPQIDGVLLDTLIDYMTYVFIPAFALYQSGLMDGWSGWVAIIVITFCSALYVCDTSMKTTDYSFAGFPACWNMVVLVLFALHPHWAVCLAFVLLLTITMFTSVKFVHPVRTNRWRAVTLPAAVLWVVCAGWAAVADFDAGLFVHWGLLLTSVYLIAAGAVQQVLYGHDG